MILTIAIVIVIVAALVLYVRYVMSINEARMKLLVLRLYTAERSVLAITGVLQKFITHPFDAVYPPTQDLKNPLDNLTNVDSAGDLQYYGAAVVVDPKLDFKYKFDEISNGTDFAYVNTLVDAMKEQQKKEEKENKDSKSKFTPRVNMMKPSGIY